MDLKKIISSDYLDILFEGKNKKYGSYELRKKYSKRASLSAGILFGVIALGFATTLLKPKEEFVPPPPPPNIEDVVLTEPPPIEPDAPPPPELPPAPAPPARATLDFTTPKIAKNEEVKPEQRIEDPNKEENKDKDVSNTTREGDNSAKEFENPFEGVQGGSNTKTAGEGSGDDNSIKTKVDVKAKPPKDWLVQVKRNMRYPEMAKANDITGRVTVTFVVEKNGSITDVKVEGKDPGGGLGAEAVRVVKMLGAFTPAIAGGNPVRSYHRMPIEFNLATN